MAFDPNKPTENTLTDAAEMRGQLNALKALIDAQQAQINALQTQLNQAAKNPGVGEFDPGMHDPPTFEDVEAIRGVINQIIFGMNW
jgi:hypothetical protein